MKLSFLAKKPSLPSLPSLPGKTYMVVVDNCNTPEPGLETIYLQLEPEEFIPYREYLLENWKLYFKIYTYDHILLEKCPNTVKYIFGNNSFGYIPNNDNSKKQFKISSLTGDKDHLIGHRLRKKIYENQSKFPDNFVFFVSHMARTLVVTTNNPIIYASKLPLFDTFQFSIVIECSQQPNYFTEKLNDCLLKKSIPIYWGCPNIGEYFDTTGWIIINDINILEMINVLTPNYYSMYQSIVEKNYNTAKQYCSLQQNLQKVGLLMHFQ